MGFDLFQGYHFARPEMLTGKRTNPSKLALLNILSLLLKEAENDEIEEAFKGHVDLTYNLMRMVNSVGTGITTKISSLRHGLMILGRKPIRRWVQLLLYASDKWDVTANPLMQLAASRGKLLELVVLQEFPGEMDYADEAFMVGILSLLDTLLGEPMAYILARMSLQEDVEAALLRREGGLGELLVLSEKIEAGDIEAVEQALQAHPGLTMDALNKAQMEAMGWANEIAR